MINFNEIPNVIKKEDVDAGLIIHETQLSYKLEGLIKIVDVGKWWYKKTGLPVPLGINVMKNKFSHDIMIEFDNCLRRSIEYGLNHMEDAVDYAMKYNRNKPKNIITKFVKMYVNDITINMGESGKKSIIHLFNLAKKNNIIKNEFKIKII